MKQTHEVNGGDGVWLHGHVKSMVAMELGGVVEGGLKLDASRW